MRQSSVACVVVALLAAVACDDATRAPTQSGADAAVAAGTPVTVTARVVDSMDTRNVLPGITVHVLDGKTGAPLEPAVTGVSDAAGEVDLTVPAHAALGIKAGGNAAYLDTYVFPFETDAPHPVIRVEGTYRGEAAPQFDAETARVRGEVLWKRSDMERYEPIGCARIEAHGEDLEAQGLRYSAGEGPWPSSPAAWPLERGTNPDNGWFHISDMKPGTHQLRARLRDGRELGSLEFPVFPRRVAGTSPQGQPDHQVLVMILVEGPASASNPTPDDCVF